MCTDFLNPENQTHKHMIPIIHINTQTQTHKHVHPHNKSKNFFSKHKQNPKVRNEREERGGDRGVQRVEDPTNPPESDRPEAQRVDPKSIGGRIWFYL